MYGRRSVCLFVLSALLAAPAVPQIATTPVQRDPQAVAVLNQVVTAAGGSAVLGAVQDVTASGTITFNWAGVDVPGNATVKGRGITQFRLDATVSDGNQTWAISNGQAFEKGPDGTVTPGRYRTPSSFANVPFPLAHLLSAIGDSSMSLSYVGLETRNSSQVHHIQVKSSTSAPGNGRGIPTSRLDTTDFFIDSTTAQIVAVLSVAFSNDFPGQTCPRELRFSDYRTVNGLVAPFSIIELVDGQRTFAIQLNQVSFNTGLSDKDFEP